MISRDKEQHLIGNSDELKDIFQKTCFGGYKEIIQLYVDHFDEEDEESRMLHCRDLLFNDNPFADSALNNYIQKEEKAENFGLGEYLYRLKANNGGKAQIFINVYYSSEIRDV